MYNPTIHHRRSIRLKEYEYSQAGGYFVTTCVRDRQCLMGTIVKDEMIFINIGGIVNDILLRLPQQYRYVQLNELVIMPNHIHALSFY